VKSGASSVESHEWTEEAIIELWNERAAIREHEGGLSRTAAERAAYFDLKRLVPVPFVVPDVIKEAMRLTTPSAGGSK
jgi:hypothetical protein